MVLGQPLGHFPLGITSRNWRASLSWYIVDTRPKQRSCDLPIRRSSRHSLLYELHSCALCREVSHPELFTKIPFLPLALLIVFVMSLPRLMTIGWDRNKDLQLCGVWKIPVSSPRSGEANAQLRLLSYSVYQPPCSAFRHSWIPLHCSTMVRPAPVYCRSLAACTALRQRPNTSVFLVTIFSPAHAAENRSNARWRPCWEDAVSTKLSAKNKRLILPLPSVTLTSSRLLPCIQFIDCEQEWWQHTHPYRSPTPMANGCRLTLPTQKRTFEQECNELKTSNRRPSTLHWGFSRAIVML